MWRDFYGLTDHATTLFFPAGHSPGNEARTTSRHLFANAHFLAAAKEPRWPTGEVRGWAAFRRASVPHREFRSRTLCAPMSLYEMTLQVRPQNSEALTFSLHLTKSAGSDRGELYNEMRGRRVARGRAQSSIPAACMQPVALAAVPGEPSPSARRALRQPTRTEVTRPSR